MIKSLQRTLTFDKFMESYPEDGKCYELIDGEVVEMRPRGDHEDISSLITRKLDREIERCLINNLLSVGSRHETQPQPLADRNATSRSVLNFP
ncbi:MAG: Uma2 family endonuclease [Hormoscilla sp. GM7CHS1pb]|nr:Uma2 family endonuclease [Hormoscilla sp. GM7CHS1pb]